LEEEAGDDNSEAGLTAQPQWEAPPAPPGDLITSPLAIANWLLFICAPAVCLLWNVETQTPEAVQVVCPGDATNERGTTRQLDAVHASSMSAKLLLSDFTVPPTEPSSAQYCICIFIKPAAYEAVHARADLDCGMYLGMLFDVMISIAVPSQVHGVNTPSKTRIPNCSTRTVTEETMTCRSAQSIHQRSRYRYSLLKVINHAI
jgi:hypothetical protein